ncbi:Uncharacterised protein [Orientia tsutsugamushi]|uniref:Uncharacterized protein n=1 Tax=Orientia tsutsugamushi TaxID=784 RepID=A0A2U3RCE9_ORITS|nr:Uncharacterised protein [Orientia tsutsugamushi]
MTQVQHNEEVKTNLSFGIIVIVSMNSFINIVLLLNDKNFFIAISKVLGCH